MSNIEFDNIEDITYEEEIREKEWKKIKHFTVNDYLSCKQTKELLLQEWDKKFNDNLEPNIENVMKKHIDNAKNTSSNILCGANMAHISDLIMLVKYHVVKDYDLTLFEEDPELAQPLVHSIDDIRKKQKNAIKQQQIENFKNMNKTYNWGK